MINLDCFQSSFYLGWAEKLLAEEDEEWKWAGVAALSAVGGKYAFRCNVPSKNFKGLGLVRNCFWQNVLRVWLDNNNNSPRLLYDIQYSAVAFKKLYE